MRVVFSCSATGTRLGTTKKYAIPAESTKKAEMEKSSRFTWQQFYHSSRFLWKGTGYFRPVAYQILGLIWGNKSFIISCYERFMAFASEANALSRAELQAHSTTDFSRE